MKWRRSLFAVTAGKFRVATKPTSGQNSPLFLASGLIFHFLFYVHFSIRFRDGSVTSGVARLSLGWRTKRAEERAFLSAPRLDSSLTKP